MLQLPSCAAQLKVPSVGGATESVFTTLCNTSITNQLGVIKNVQKFHK